MTGYIVRIALCILMCIGAAAVSADALEAPAIDATWTAVPLESLDLSRMLQDFGSAQAGKSIIGKPLTLGGTVYERGVGSHAGSDMVIDLKGKAKLFTATVGVDDETEGKGSVRFTILLDGKAAARTPVMRGGDKPVLISAKLDGVKQMVLRTEDAGDGITFDHADWADAVIWLPMLSDQSHHPEAVLTDETPMEIAHVDPNRLSINGPRITGATPGRPFLFLIPATGRGKLRFSAKGLPAGLTLDPDTGIISGALKQAGEWDVEITVTENSPAATPSPCPLPPGEGRQATPPPLEGGGRGRGSVKRTLTIVGGTRKLALTPPMGWNSWYCWMDKVDDPTMRAAADRMVSSGLAAHGYQYVNIDDGWAGARNANGEIQSNERFPDMKALGDYIHGTGLKFGIYSSPGPLTCTSYEGSYRHEVSDARTYAKWGVDFFKHDWCSYGRVAKDHSIPELQKPYMLMRLALDQADRDIVYSLCQYGMGSVWEWGESVGANMWRTTGDLFDGWSAMIGTGLRHAGLSKHVGPGHWNDPDMLCIGRLGFGQLRPSKLKPNEQITQMTLWSMIAAPLLIGGDIMEMDRFTLDLLCNDEVIAVDQDPLGKAADRVRQDGDTEVWARPLADGTQAVALFNLGPMPAKITVRWSDLGLNSPRPSGGEGSGVRGFPVRDLWRRKDLGSFADSFTAEVPRHGAWLIKVGR